MVVERERLDVTDREVVALSEVFRLLGDPTRVRLVLLLCEGERNVSELCAALKLPQPTVSHHLGLLRRGGMLASRRDGRSICYRLDDRLEFFAGLRAEHRQRGRLSGAHRPLSGSAFRSLQTGGSRHRRHG